MEVVERYRGCLLGLAVGDAVGTTLEFSSPGGFTPITDMIGGGPFCLKAGQWTDDTAMALCLAESLVECNGFDLIDQLKRYVRWYRDGHLSSTGHCFDIGMATRAALHGFETHGRACPADSAGNGCLMRLAPVPLFFTVNPVVAIERAGESALSTHADREAVDACRYFAGLLVGALKGATKAELLSPNYSPAPDGWKDLLVPSIATIARGSFTQREPPQIKGGGYVVECLEAALWAFYKSDDFKDGCLLAANLGDDSDTTAAVFGQIGGAFYGEFGIPEAWRMRTARHDLIVSLAERLLALRPTDF